MNDDFRKHLDLIQSVIVRMAGNSFSVKTWAVGLIAILGGLAARDADSRLACTLLFPAFCFWGLDAYYLRQEKLFRTLYEKVVAQDAKSPFSGEVDGIVKVAWSPTVRWLHCPILLFVIGLVLYSFIGAKPQNSAKSDAGPAVITAPHH